MEPLRFTTIWIKGGIIAVIKPRRVNNRPGFLTMADVQYDPERDCYLCPQAKGLRLKTIQYPRHRKIYAADRETCGGCPLGQRCTTSKTQGRLLSKFMDDHFEQAERLVKTARGKTLLRQRQTVIEGIFGEAKSFHLLRRALFRGKAKLKIQLLLTAALLNLKRLMRWKPKGKTEKMVAAVIRSLTHSNPLRPTTSLSIIACLLSLQNDPSATSPVLDITGPNTNIHLSKTLRNH